VPWRHNSPLWHLASIGATSCGAGNDRVRTGRIFGPRSSGRLVQLEWEEAQRGKIGMISEIVARPYSAAVKYLNRCAKRSCVSDRNVVVVLGRAHGSW